MSIVRGQHWLLKTRAGDIWDIFLENNLLRYRFFTAGYQFPPAPETLVGTPVIDYSAIIDASDNLHLACILKSGELKYYIGCPGRNWNSTVLAEFDTKAQYLRYLTLMLTSKRVHIFLLTSSMMNAFVWAIMHSFWNGKEWKEQHIGEIISGKNIAPFSVDKDSQENIHFIYTSAVGGRNVEPYYKKFNKNFDLWGHTETIAQMPDNTLEVFGLVDRKDTFHVIASGISGAENRPNITYRRRKEITKHNNPWENMVTISNSFNGTSRPMLSCRDSNLFALWREQTQFMYSVSHDWGSGWSRAASVDMAGRPVLITFRSNSLRDVGRTNIPLVPGTSGSVVQMFLDEDKQLFPPPVALEMVTGNYYPPAAPETEKIIPPAVQDNAAAGQEEEVACQCPGTGDEGVAGQVTGVEEGQPEGFAEEVAENGHRDDEEDDVSRLIRENESIKTSLEDLKLDDQLICTTVEEMESKMAGLDQGLGAANDSVERLHLRYEEIITQVAEKIQTAFSASEVLESMKAELKAVRNCQSEIDDRVNVLTTGRLEYDTALDEMEKRRLVLSESLEQLAARFENLEKRNSEDVVELQKDIKNIAGELTKIPHIEESIIDIFKQLKKEHGAMKGMVDELFAGQKQIESHIDEIVKSRELVESEINEKLAVLAGSMVDNRDKTEELSGLLAGTQGKVEELAGQIVGHGEKVDHFFQRVDSSHQVFQEELYQHREEIDALGARLEQYLQEQAEMYTMQADARKMILMLQEGQTDHEKAREELFGEMRLLRGDFVQQQELLQQLTGAGAGLEKELSRIAEEQKKESQQLKGFQESGTKLRAEVKTEQDKLKKELGGIISEQLALQKLLEGLREEHEKTREEQSLYRQEQSRTREGQIKEIFAGMLELKEQGKLMLTQVKSVQIKQGESARSIASLESKYKELQEQLTRMEKEQKMIQEELTRQKNSGLFKRMFG